MKATLNLLFKNHMSICNLPNIHFVNLCFHLNRAYHTALYKLVQKPSICWPSYSRNNTFLSKPRQCKIATDHTKYRIQWIQYDFMQNLLILCSREPWNTPNAHKTPRHMQLLINNISSDCSKNPSSMQLFTSKINRLHSDLVFLELAISFL